MSFNIKTRRKDPGQWRKIIGEYQAPDPGRSLWQLGNTLIPYLLLWGLMIWSLEISYWLTLGLAVPAGGFMVRLFIFFHDCGHGSFFKSSRANHHLGIVLGVLVFTPYYHWRQSHAVHHATAGNLDKRGTGDVWTMTVKEFRSAPRIKQIGYRVYRNPLIMFGIGPLASFLIFQRIPNRKFRKRERASIHWTNLSLVILTAVMSLAIGFKDFWMIQLPVLWVASTTGVWLFYVQHQFENVYWERAEDWDFVRAGLEGSSFYRLPKVLQWFSGNIGFHHIHHLGPRIPNYLLERCYRENPLFQIQPVTLLSSLKSLTFRLWDESREQLVHYRDLKDIAPQSAGQGS